MTAGFEALGRVIVLSCTQAVARRSFMVLFLGGQHSSALRRWYSYWGLASGLYTMLLACLTRRALAYFYTKQVLLVFSLVRP